MFKIFLNKKTISFFLFLAIFFVLSSGFYSSVQAKTAETPQKLAIGYDFQLFEQFKNLSNSLKKYYSFLVKTKNKTVDQISEMPKAYYFAVKQAKEESSAIKIKFLSFSAVYKSSIFSSIANIPNQTAGIISSILSPVGDFFSGLFIKENNSEIADVAPIEKSSSSRKSSSSSAIPAQAGINESSNKSDNLRFANTNSESSASSFATAGITRREVLGLIKQSDDRNLALIKTLFIAPIYSSVADYLSIQQSISNLSREISALQENNTRQVDHVYNSISRSFDNITSLDGVTMTNSSFSGTTGTFTGLFTGASGTFSGDLVVGSELTVSGTGTSTLAGDTSFDSGTLYIDSINNRVGIASSSPSDTLSINGATYLSQISAPSSTVDRLYNSSGDLYWNGNLIGSASVGNWTLSGSNVYRSSGNVGIGTTSPYARLSVVGETVSSYFTATSTTQASTFPYASTTAISATTASTTNLIVSNNSTLGTVISGIWNGSTIGVAYGGTGQTSFTQGWLNSNGTTLSASTSPTVNYITATSTIATSTFAGGLAVETNGFVYDYSTNRVGIGTASPNQKLTVVGGSILLDNNVGYMGADTGGVGVTLLKTTIGDDTMLNTKAANYISFAVGQVEKMRMSAAGGFSLGDSTYYTTDPGAGSAIIQGNIGIGTTSPNWKLSVAGIGSFDDYIRASYFTATSTTQASTFPYASTTAISATTASTTNLIVSNNSTLGTVISGIWNGTTIGVGYGGTGQTSFGQGWLNSDGTTLSASTSPTVNYITATSTTATSTFAGGVDLTATGNGLNFGSNTLFYQNNQRFLTSSTTSAGNLTIGYQSATNMDANGGLYNTGVGYQVMQNATSTQRNVAVGYQALLGSATVSTVGRNVAVGYQSLKANTSGNNNTATGYISLSVNTTGNENTAYGSNSLSFNTAGSSNTGIGFLSLSSNTTGSTNVAIGYDSLRANTTGAGNVGSGFRAGWGDNSFVDQRSVIDNYMTFIGYQASRDASIASTTVLTNGTAIGKNARVAQSNTIILGGTGTDAVNVGLGTTSPWAKLSIQNTYGNITPLFDIASSTSAAYATTSVFRVNADGNVGIATTSPNWKLSVVGNASIDDYVRASYFTATSTTLASTFPYASTTALTVSGSTYLGSLTGTLQAVNGLVSATSSISSNFIEDAYLRNNADDTTTGQLTAASFVASSASATSTFAGGLAVETNGLVYDYSTNNVGIGTASPSYLFHVYSNTNPAAITTPTASLDMAAANGSSILRFNRPSTFRIAGEQYATAGVVDWYSGVLYSSSGNSAWSVSSDNTLYNSKLVLTTAGSVGIGTTSPYSLLTLYKAGSTAATSPQLVLSASSTVAGLGNFLNNWAIGTDLADGGKFKISSSSVIGTNDRFVIDGSGNVGVGTAAPQRTLHVLGGGGTDAAIIGSRYQVNGSDYGDLSASAGVGLIAVGNYGGMYTNLPTNPLGTQWTTSGVVGLATGNTGSAYAYGVSGLGRVDTTSTGRIAGGYFNANANTVLSGAESFYGVYSTALGTTNTTGSDNVYGIYSTATGQGTDITYGGYFSGSGGGKNYGVYSNAGTNYFAGLVGIGTTTPNNLLDIYSTTKSAIGFSGASDSTYKWTMGMDVSNGGRFSIASSTALGTTDRFVIDGSGNVGVGTTNPVTELDVAGSISLFKNAENPYIQAGDDTSNKWFGQWDSVSDYARFQTVKGGTYSGNFAFQVNGGNVGIGTTSPWRTLSVNGTMAATALTAGAAGDYAVCINNTTKEITNAGASGCVVSSKRFKENISSLDSGLDELMRLKPSKFNYISQTGEHIGLIAEDMDMVDKRLVEYESDGITPRTVRYMELSALIIKSMQELNLNMQSLISTTTATTPQSFANGFFGNIFAKTASWLADSANGIGEVFANNFRAKEKICVDDQCLTKDDVKALLDISKQGKQSSSAISSSSASSVSSAISSVSSGSNGSEQSSSSSSSSATNQSSSETASSSASSVSSNSSSSSEGGSSSSVSSGSDGSEQSSSSSSSAASQSSSETASSSVSSVSANSSSSSEGGSSSSESANSGLSSSANSSESSVGI